MFSYFCACFLGIVLALLTGPDITARRLSILRIGFSLPAGSRTGSFTAADTLRSETLGTISSDGHVQPRLAESWSRSADGRTWTFEIADGVLLHSGRLVNTELVAELLRTALRLPLNIQTYPGLKDVEHVQAIDGAHIVLRSSSPRITLLTDLAELALGEGNEESAAGPFNLESFSKTGFVATGFPKYYRGRPGVDRVEFHGFPSLRSAWAALMRDELDALYEVSRDAIEFVEQDRTVRTFPFLRPYPATLFFNSASPKLLDRRVRLALAHIVNRQAIAKAALRGRGRAAEGPLWPQHWAVQHLASIAPFDPILARHLLMGAGYGRPGQAAPVRLRFRCLVVAAETQPFERIALLLQKQFFDAGVDMELELLEPRDLLSRLSQGKFEAALFESAAFTTSWVYSFWHSPSPGAQVWIRHGYSAADAQLEAMQNARQDDELKRGVEAVYRKMAEDPPAIFIAWPEVTRAVSTRFEVPVEKGRDIMGGNLWLWRPAKDR